MKLYHLKDNSETGPRADRQSASDVWTPSDLFFHLKGCSLVHLHHLGASLIDRSTLSDWAENGFAGCNFASHVVTVLHYHSVPQ